MSNATKVIAKFKVVSIENLGEMNTIRLYPVVNGSEENERFFKYTPAGSIELAIVNPNAANYFELGGDYYVVFTRDSK